MQAAAPPLPARLDSNGAGVSLAGVTRPTSPHRAGPPRWGVVATLDEPAPLALAFAGWHLAQGAAGLHLFLDRADPCLQAALSALPFCHVTLCDADHWAGARPEAHTARQTHNANLALESCELDWLLHADADEFIPDGAWLSAMLAGLPEDALALRLTVLERVHIAGQAETSIFDGAFRRASGDYPDWGPVVHGRFAKFLENGLTGHAVGKTLMRPGTDLRFGIHFAKHREGGAIAQAETQVMHHRLLHFDGLTRLHYARKLMARAREPDRPGRDSRHSPARRAQIRYARNKASDPREFGRLIDAVKTLNGEQFEALGEMGLAERLPFDPGPALARMGLDLDLSPEHFDALLIDRDPELAALGI